MGCFLYFIPRGGLVLDDIAAAGLDDRVSEGFTSPGRTIHGPEQIEGWLIAMLGKDEPFPGYNAEKQTWRKCAGGAYWLGFATDSPPGPEDLIRPEAAVAWGVKMGDGKKWLVPSQKVMPKYWDVDGDGEAFKKSRPEYTALSEKAGALYDVFVEQGFDGLLEWISKRAPEMRDTAIEALRLTYRVTKYEIAALGLLDDTAVGVTMLALIDSQEISSPADEAKKKEGSDGG